jgi:hypothetical protein
MAKSMARLAEEEDGVRGVSWQLTYGHPTSLRIAQICAIRRYDGPRIREKNPEARPQAGCRCLLWSWLW